MRRISNWDSASRWVRIVNLVIITVRWLIAQINVNRWVNWRDSLPENFTLLWIILETLGKISIQWIGASDSEARLKFLVATEECPSCTFKKKPNSFPRVFFNFLQEAPRSSNCKCSSRALVKLATWKLLYTSQPVSLALVLMSSWWWTKRACRRASALKAASQSVG